MADLPVNRFHLPVISSFGPETGALAAAAITAPTAATGGSATYPAGNLAIYVPFRLWSPYLVRLLWWANGAAVAGNTDCGIYTGGGTLLTSAGSTAQAGTTTLQTVTLGTPLLLTPGSYYMAMNASSASAQYLRAAQAAAPYAAIGYAQQAVGAIALPATATFAAYAQTYQPLFGIASTTTI